MEIAHYAVTPFGGPRTTPGRHGYVAYFPRPIPRHIDLTPALITLMADAEAALGGLAGAGRSLPSPHLLIRPYLPREAVASTRIEGTQTSILQMLDLEADGAAPSDDLEEVVNYISALEWSVGEIERLPLGSRLICGVHDRLLAGVRGRERMPGQMRISQNGVGSPGSTIATARFVPPPPQELPGLLSDWERYAHETDGAPLLVRVAMLHYQFETLHPVLDGNGRVGRLLIVLSLIDRGRLPSPLLYLSSYLERAREDYYEALQAIRQRGDVVPWLLMFLEAVRAEATDAISRAHRILDLRERYRGAVTAIAPRQVPRLVDLVCEAPIVTTRRVRDRLGVSGPSALSLLRRLEELNILEELPQGPRGLRRYCAPEMLAAIAGDHAPEGGPFGRAPTGK